MVFSVVIPARLASTRLPNKALADIAGKPMIVRVAEQASKSLATQVIVATDHQDIIQACETHNIKALLTSTEHPSGTDRIAQVTQMLKLPDEHIIVNVQGDEPLVNPELINQLAVLLASSSAPMATAAHPIDDVAHLFNPNVVKVVLNAQNEALYFSRAPIPWDRDSLAQDKHILPSKLPVLRHIGLYAYRSGFLNEYQHLSPSILEQTESLEQLRVLWHGKKIVVTLTNEAPETGVDTQEDLERVRQIFNQQIL
ncbi:3-deoxy-manno-octulosonate cytidylyltransferase [Neisseria sp. Ec49-e6-T10]|uniref:3-deoxy-manno-octulosonate cytidylyltransferase n=1 Tax=Neisseria sp. Ec49-e6-T10 TaxID=3140744 RepID=UPI003EC0A38A